MWSGCRRHQRWRCRHCHHKKTVESCVLVKVLNRVFTISSILLSVRKRNTRLFRLLSLSLSQIAIAFHSRWILTIQNSRIAKIASTMPTILRRSHKILSKKCFRLRNRNNSNLAKYNNEMRNEFKRMSEHDFYENVCKSCKYIAILR